MELTPRWEYRCWTNPTHAQALFDGDWSATPVENRTDIYLVGPDPAFMPKLRNGDTFEIKRLVESQDGMELWAPHLRVPLPCPLLPFDQIQAAGMSEFAEACHPADFINIATNAAQWSAVATEKFRRLFGLGNMQCEVTKVILAHKEYWTFAAEAEEFSPLTRLVEKLQLKNLPNLSYRNFIITVV